MSPAAQDRFLRWHAALESRHLETLKFAEVRRALQALSSVYVQRRDRITRGAALDSTGKRAAFALFYGPLHFLAVQHALKRLRPLKPYPKRIIDLGCGSGGGAAAWATVLGGRPAVRGYDLHPWALQEAAWTYQQFGLDHAVTRRDAERAPMPGAQDALLAAWVVNELREGTRDALLPRLMQAGGSGAELLVVEPVAKRPLPWWTGWEEAFREIGGRSDTWEFEPAMPESLRLLDRAAKLNHRRFRFRTLSVNISGTAT